MRRQREAATALYVRQTTGASDSLFKLIEGYGFFPPLWEGLGEGAKLDAHKPSPRPSPKGRGRKNRPSTRFCLLVCALIMMSIEDRSTFPRAQSHMSQSPTATEQSIARPMTALYHDVG